MHGYPATGPILRKRSESEIKRRIAASRKHFKSLEPRLAKALQVIKSAGPLFRPISKGH